MRLRREPVGRAPRRSARAPDWSQSTSVEVDTAPASPLPYVARNSASVVTRLVDAGRPRSCAPLVRPARSNALPVRELACRRRPRAGRVGGVLVADRRAWCRVRLAAGTVFSQENRPRRGSCCAVPSVGDAEDAAFVAVLLVGEVDLPVVAAPAAAVEELARIAAACVEQKRANCASTPGRRCRARGLGPPGTARVVGLRWVVVVVDAGLDQVRPARRPSSVPRSIVNSRDEGARLAVQAR